VQAEYGRRYAKTVERLCPILSTLSSSAAITPDLRRRAAAELRGLRELFDQARTDDDHSALAPINAAIQRAEQRGVDVTLQLDVGPDGLDELCADNLGSVIEGALDDAESFARVVITRIDGQVTGSIVHGVGTSDTVPASTHGVDLDIIEVADTRWVQYLYE
jgi:hypothetical protein